MLEPPSRGAYARALAFCRARRVFRPGERVLVGTAGGASSLGVLGFLSLAQRDLGLGEIAAACIDAGGDDDPEFVADAGRLARSVGATFHAISVDRRLDSQAIRDALRAHARSFGYGLVALGHTRDDAVAQVLARLVRGDASHAPRPLPARSKQGFTRPLLALRDPEALELARTAGLEPPPLMVPDAEQRPGLELRLRRTVLPRLRVEAAGADDALLAFAARLSAFDRAVREAARDELRRSPHGPDGSAAHLSVRPDRSPVVAEALAREALLAAGADARGAEYPAALAHLTRLLRGRGGARPGTLAQAPRTVVLAPGLVATVYATPTPGSVALRRLRAAVEPLRKRG